MTLVWARAGVLGAVALASGVVSHAWGGGRLPGVLPLALLLGVSVVLAAGFLRVRATPLRLVALVVAGQAVMHAALSLLAGHRGEAARASGVARTSAPPSPATTPPAAGGSLRDYYAATVPAPPRGAGASTGTDLQLLERLGHQVDHLAADPLMVLGHAAGAAVLGLFLAVGETALWRLLHLVAARTAVAGAAWRLVTAARAARSGIEMLRLPAPVRRPPVRGVQRLDVGSVLHRGPPVLLAA